MRLAYLPPDDWTYALAGGAWVSDVRLHNRIPRERTRVRYTAGATTASKLVITATRPTPFSPRAGAMLSLVGVPVGTKVEIVGVAAAGGGLFDIGGNSKSQRVGYLPDGSTGIVWDFNAGLVATVGYSLAIFNDVNGAAAFAADTLFEIGEIVVAPAVTLPHEMGWGQGRVDPSKVDRTAGGSIARVRRPNWRKMTVRPLFGDEDQARSGALENGLSYERLLSILADDPFVLVIEEPDRGAALIQSSALFGIVTKLPDLNSVSGPYFQFQEFEFEGVPN